MDKQLKALARKAVLMGIGLGVVTKRKAEEVAKQLLKEGRANEPEVRKFANEIRAEAEKRQKKLQAMLNSEVKKYSAKADAALKKAKAEYEKKLKKAKPKKR
ncbi:MAG: hypothetical protein KJ955_02995 [Nanoarchaeota archaeon]|nr:hypothetical protein [Nanoarchaeota archaeon]